MTSTVQPLPIASIRWFLEQPALPVYPSGSVCNRSHSVTVSGQIWQPVALASSSVNLGLALNRALSGAGSESNTP